MKAQNLKEDFLCRTKTQFNTAVLVTISSLTSAYRPKKQISLSASGECCIRIILKSIAEAKVAVNELGNFQISVEERNRFITDNGDMLFNDYSRKISENVRKLIDCYGETEAYAKLKEHPEVLRIGLD